MKRKGFTLIELLIVVAIIAILAAIAVPNFLEAQTRAKVSRLKADMRTGDVGEKAYYVDNNKYTWDRQYDATASINRLGGWFFNQQYLLTTPIAYLASVQFPDPFFAQNQQVEFGQEATSWKYFNYGYGTGAVPPGTWGDYLADGLGSPIDEILPTAGYAFTSYGPDFKYQGGEWAGLGLDFTGGGFTGIDRLYDPTNGTVSLGDIVRVERPGLDIK